MADKANDHPAPANGIAAAAPLATAAAAVAAAAAAGPKVGAIVAQPPPGFGTQPVATYAKHLDELQSLPLVRGVRVYLNTGTVETLKGGLEELGLRNMVVDFFVPDVTNSSVVDIVRECAGTTFNIEHLGCGCDVKALHDDKELFKRWR